MEIIKHPLENVDYVGSDNDKDTIIHKYYLIKNLNRKDTLGLKSLIYKSIGDDMNKVPYEQISRLHHFTAYFYCEYIDNFRGRVSDKTDIDDLNFLNMASELNAYVLTLSTRTTHKDTLVYVSSYIGDAYENEKIRNSEYKYKDFIKLCKDYQNKQ